MRNGSRRISYGKLLFRNSSRILAFILSRSRQQGVSALAEVVRRRFLDASRLRSRVLQMLLGQFVVLYAQVTRSQRKTIQRGDLRFRAVHGFCILISACFGRGGRIRRCTSVLGGSPGALTGVLSTCRRPSTVHVVRGHVRTRTQHLLLCATGDSGRVTLVLKFRSRTTFDHFFGGTTKLDTARCHRRCGG